MVAMRLLKDKLIHRDLIDEELVLIFEDTPFNFNN